MKVHAIFLLLFTSAASIAFAQNGNEVEIKEPDFVNEPMLLDSNYSAIQLPLERAELINKGSSASVLVENVSSATRFSGKSDFTFVVKHSNPMVPNPKDVYKVFKLVVNGKKKNRTCEIMTLENHSLKNLQGLPVTFKKVRDGIYTFSVNIAEKGEYAIVMGTKLYTFGID